MLLACKETFNSIAIKKAEALHASYYFLYKMSNRLFGANRISFLFLLLAMLVTAIVYTRQKGGIPDPGKINVFWYNLREPEVITLPATINEISGIVYDKNDHLFAVDDEQGALFRIKLQKEPAVEQWPIGKKIDYEELVLTDQTFYLLSSSGTIVYFQNSFPVKNIQEARLDQKGRNEYEILFKDPAAPRLLMMCKSCKDDKKGEVSVYAFDLATKSFGTKLVAALKVKEIEDKLQEKVGTFKPSAANVHPVTGDIYIISSINGLLLVADRNFRVKEVHKLERWLFKQPEGLCFSPSGDLLISNEAAGQGTATILLFRQQP